MYSYEVLKPKLFTDEGWRMFLRIRDDVQRHLKESGAVRLQEAISGQTGDSWLMLACIDRMLELGEIREVMTPGSEVTQYRVFVSTKG